jgi:hypothetical protein
MERTQQGRLCVCQPRADEEAMQISCKSRYVEAPERIRTQSALVQYKIPRYSIENKNSQNNLTTVIIIMIILGIKAITCT